MGAVERLHPHLRHALVHDLGWRSLRPVQEQCIEAVLDGSNAVVLAPTAGGKTEAAVFPVLSRILSEQPRPVAALYLCPIRALLNNQEPRFQAYCHMVGLDAFKWHGDVGEARRERFRRDPCHLLLTTPESLEVMLVGARTDARALFADLGTVVVDEVHAFAGDDRGAHLAALLERLCHLCGRDFQRIGLSATVGNPVLLGRWLQGSSERPLRLVDPPRAPVERDLALEHCGDLDEAARVIGQKARGRKSLVFVESRAGAERVAHALEGSQVEVFIHHSSVSRADRALAEERFAAGRNTAIVCTSTMELGLDVGDLDQVIQVDAPATVASFLQRLGRTGRRPGTRPTCTFVCQGALPLLQACAVVRLAERGWVEDLRPPVRAVHVLAHQVMALTLQEGGISRHRVLEQVGRAYPFYGLGSERLYALLDTMLARGILYEADGRLSLGAEGERRYGRKNFFDLYAVFSSPPVMRVLCGRDEVGYVQALFAAGHDSQEGPLCFRLAGRAWQVVGAEWAGGVLQVRPAEQGRVPSWLGGSDLLSMGLCQEMWRALSGPGAEAPFLAPGAERELAALRGDYAPLVEEGSAPLEQTPEGVTWHTFAGGRVNRLLSAGLRQLSGARWTAGNLALRARDLPLTATREGLRQLPDLDWDALAATAARDRAHGMLSKFQPCLPPEDEARLLAEKLLDVEGVRGFLSRSTTAPV